MTAGVTLMGAGGRMGQAIVRTLSDEAELTLAAAVTRSDDPVLEKDAGDHAGVGPLGVMITADLEQAVATGDVVIDFSSADVSATVVAACARAGKPLVIGTTGLGDGAEAALTEACASIPVVAAANTSVGVTVLRHLASRAAQLLGEDYDIEVVEMHHRRKVDAPSGTAVVLAETLARARDLDPLADVVHGRSGAVGPRSRREIGVMTLRGGDVVGDHTVILAGPGERLELVHRAQDRSLFALGAVRAAKWLVKERPSAGRYGMADVLNLPKA